MANWSHLLLLIYCFWFARERAPAKPACWMY